MTAKSKIFLLFLGCQIGLGGCTGPGNESWPKVSFGAEIAATEEALGQPPQVSLAPLPTLLPEETRGIENPAAYIEAIEADFREIISSMNARFQDYQKAKGELAADQGEDKTRDWLAGQMELSNISQYTEDLTKLRAKLSALPDPRPEKARVLLAQIEARELQSRVFLRAEKQTLQELEPA